MPNIEQIGEWKKEFEEKFGLAWEDSHSSKYRHPAEGIREFLWQFIQKALAKQAKDIIEEMLVEEREMKKVIDKEFRNGDDCDYVINHCCALQKKKADKIIEKYI